MSNPDDILYWDRPIPALSGSVVFVGVRRGNGRPVPQLSETAKEYLRLLPEGDRSTWIISMRNHAVRAMDQLSPEAKQTLRECAPVWEGTWDQLVALCASMHRFLDGLDAEVEA